MKECLIISVSGVVQGVGFRPFIYRLAKEMGIKGHVSNTSEGVIISAEGQSLNLFIERIRLEAPPLSKIESIDIYPSTPSGAEDFIISESLDTGAFTLVSPDIAVCHDCKKELFNMKDRRYLYPFINCTNCGPRYSIVKSVPYDRPNTTMSSFRMCSECSTEYDDPDNRRFHAQPNACAACGPHMTLYDYKNELFFSKDAVYEAIKLLSQGRILAIKGLGGFHLACDAVNNEAVTRLRKLKRKNNKPFALMAPDVETVRRYCIVSDYEARLLNSAQRPIVILRKRKDINLPEALAPNNRYLGFMLPYTPLHYLLFFHPLSCHSSYVDKNCFTALVMTSGNISEEPIIISNDEAVEKLKIPADAFLLHDRDIFMRVDDSVVRHFNFAVQSGNTDTSSLVPDASTGTTLFIRRARGYTPDPILLPDDGADVLACGADVKNTFTLGKGRYAVMSQHIGDMENYETMRFFEETLANLKSVYRVKPVAVAYDLHPEYISSRWAIDHGRDNGLNMFGIQHHYAHIGSVVAEHGIKGKVIGVAFDGTGYGADGTLWGGEFMIADAYGFKRVGHIKQLPLPGGYKAIREPWRMALCYLRDAYGEQVMDAAELTGFIDRFGKDHISYILKIADDRNFSPLSSGAGRLFEAVSALLNICSINTFEGEAAIALESCVREDIEDDYPVDIHCDDVIKVDFTPTIIRLVGDLTGNDDRGTMAAKFHNTVASAISRVVIKISMINNIKDVALSGGTFQNLYLLRRVIEMLRNKGLKVFINETVPCNDAGISLGQMYLARKLMR